MPPKLAKQKEKQKAAAARKAKEKEEAAAALKNETKNDEAANAPDPSAAPKAKAAAAMQEEMAPKATEKKEPAEENKARISVTPLRSSLLAWSRARVQSHSLVLPLLCLTLLLSLHSTSPTSKATVAAAAPQAAAVVASKAVYDSKAFENPDVDSQFDAHCLEHTLRELQMIHASLVCACQLSLG